MCQKAKLLSDLNLGFFYDHQILVQNKMIFLELMNRRSQKYNEKVSKAIAAGAIFMGLTIGLILLIVFSNRNSTN